MQLKETQHRVAQSVRDAYARTVAAVRRNGHKINRGGGWNHRHRTPGAGGAAK